MSVNPFMIIVYRMGRLCGGPLEISGIEAPLFLCSGWLEVLGMGGWVGGWWGGGWLGGWVFEWRWWSGWVGLQEDFGVVGGVGGKGRGWWVDGWDGGIVGSGWVGDVMGSGWGGSVHLIGKIIFVLKKK